MYCETKSPLCSLGGFSGPEGEKLMVRELSDGHHTYRVSRTLGLGS